MILKRVLLALSVMVARSLNSVVAAQGQVREAFLVAYADSCLR